MKSSMKALMLSAAVSGILSGSTINMQAAAAGNTSVDSQHLGQISTAASATEPDKHSCKGKNDCKGQGGCKAGDNGCKAKNSCKGKGGCATDGSKPKA